MKKVLEFSIFEKPVSKARPRLGKFGVYTPIKTSQAENLIHLSAKREKIFFEKDTPLSVELIFSFKSKKSSARFLRPDIDNLIKTVLDGLNGSAFYDDAQVVCISAIKINSDKDFTKIKVSEFSEGD